MTDPTSKPGKLTRRHALECMVWAGTGVVWTLSGGIPKALNLLDEAQAAEAASSPFTFLQISDSHVGFDKEAPVTAIDTLNEAIDRIKALTVQPNFMIHTGDITHLSKPDQFDDADQIIGTTGILTHYVPGEHDMVDAGQGKAYMDRYGKDSWGQGWYSFDQNGVHFIAPGQCREPQGRGPWQSRSRAARLADQGPRGPPELAADRRIRAHPAVDDLSAMGLGHRRQRAGARAAAALRFGDGAQRPHPPDHPEGRRQYDVPHGALDRFPAAGTRRGTGAGTDDRSGRPVARHARVSPASPTRSASATSQLPTRRSPEAAMPRPFQEQSSDHAPPPSSYQP